MGESIALLGKHCCRICHEEELQDSQKLEAPCACSGTSKFAHRECIQRWCYEKGNTTCEICLQKYRPGYSAAPEIDQVAEEVIIRDNPVLNWNEQNLEIPREDEDLEERILDDSTDDRAASCCRSVAVIFIVLLLVKHMIAVLSGEAWKMLNVLWQFIMIALKSCGHIISMYIIIWTMIIIQCTIQRYHHQQQPQQTHLARFNNRDYVDEQPLRIRVDT